MKYEVLVLPAAERDVYRILTCLGKRSENAPAIWFRRWEDVVKTLSENPERCGFAPENEDHPADIRQIVFRARKGNARRQLGMFRTLLTIIAAVIMALILYTLTLDKLHSIALLKLLGAPNYTILGMLLQQAVALGVTGYVIAFLMGRQLFPYFPRRVVIANEDLLQLFLIVLAISVLSSLLGIWRAMCVQPTEALMGYPTAQYV